MAQMLDPRVTDPQAWRRWLKEGSKLGWRVWLTLLPLSVLLGLGAGWVTRQGWGAGMILIIALSGLWQAMLLATAEQAAAGKRVDIGTAIGGLMAFWRLEGKQAQRQIKVRATVMALGLAVVVLFLLVVFAVMALVGPPPGTAEAPPPVVRSTFQQVSSVAGSWATVFLWSWLLQRGGQTAMTNMLVRRHGMDWESAKRLDDLCASRNAHNLRPLAFAFLVVPLVMIFSPLLIFVIELVWVSVVTVAARDIYENKEALDPVEARVTETSGQMVQVGV